MNPQRHTDASTSSTHARAWWRQVAHELALLYIDLKRLHQDLVTDEWIKPSASSSFQVRDNPEAVLKSVLEWSCSLCEAVSASSRKANAALEQMLEAAKMQVDGYQAVSVSVPGLCVRARVDLVPADRLTWWVCYVPQPRERYCSVVAW